jgi:hypothetical protein
MMGSTPHHLQTFARTGEAEFYVPLLAELRQLSARLLEEKKHRKPEDYISAEKRPEARAAQFPSLKKSERSKFIAFENALQKIEIELAIAKSEYPVVYLKLRSFISRRVDQYLESEKIRRLRLLEKNARAAGETPDKDATYSTAEAEIYGAYASFRFQSLAKDLTPSTEITHVLFGDGQMNFVTNNKRGGLLEAVRSERVRLSAEEKEARRKRREERGT